MIAIDPADRTWWAQQNADHHDQDAETPIEAVEEPGFEPDPDADSGRREPTRRGPGPLSDEDILIATGAIG